MSAIAIEQAIPGVGPEVLCTVFGFPITNTLAMSVVVLVLFFVVGVVFKRSVRLAGGRMQTMFEFVYESMLDLIVQVAGDRETAKKIFPLVGSLMLFIIVANVITLFPIVGSLTYNGVSLFRTPTSALNTTLGLAAAMVIIVQAVSIKEWGVLGHIGKYVQIKEVYQGFREGIGSGLMAVIGFLIGLLDIISEFARVISLSLRLFGNMYAGEVLLVIIMGVVAYALPAVWIGLSFFFGLVQAVVFSALVTAYYTLALKPQEENS